MKRVLAYLLSLLMVAPAYAGETATTRTVAIVLGWDLDGAAADNAAIFADTNVVDSTSYTITAQPDACRAVVATITDADASIVAGTGTVTGTDANGNYQTTTFTLTGGSGAKTVAGIWCSIATVSNGVITGETAGTDKIRFGTTGAAGYQYPIAWGPVTQPGFGTGVQVTGNNNNRQAYQSGAAFTWARGPEFALIKTATANATALTSFTASSGAFTLVAVGDLLLINDDSDIPVQVGVRAKTDNDNITIDREITVLRTAGRGYSIRKLKVRSGIYSGWVATVGAQTVTFQIDVQQLNGTGGIDASVECAAEQALATVIVQAAAKNFAAVGTYYLDVTGAWDVCRVGLKWATNDDGTDTTTAQEIINVYASLRHN